MNFSGTYTYRMDTPSGKRETRVVIRRNPRGYEGELLSSMGDCNLLENVCVRGETISFDAQVGPARQEITITHSEGNVTGRSTILQNEGESKHAELEDLNYTPHRRRALILYATMTKNTERIALAMKETFEYYHWECNCFRLKKSNDWAAMQKDLYFDDYDVICLGSPIVAGYPLNIIDKLFSAGAGGELESNVQKQVDAGTGFVMNSETMKGPFPEGGETPGGPGGMPGSPDAPGGMPGMDGPRWRRRGCAYPGGPVRDNYQPLGIVFTTYSGSFYGSGESKATLAALKLFMESNCVSVVGTFACCGKEFGPAGLDEGQKPRVMGPGELPDPQYYDTEGGTLQGSYFFHSQQWGHPNERDINKAKYLVADIVEDYFMTYDGQRGFVSSEYTSIS